MTVRNDSRAAHPFRTIRSARGDGGAPRAPVALVALVALAALTLALPMAGCAAAAIGTAGAVGVAAVQDRTVGQAVDDATASNEIKAKLLGIGREYSEVDVEVEGGLVLLSGRVNTPQQRVKAEDVAWSVNRTEDVANEIRIEPPGGFVANVSDEIITARVRASLLASSKVKSLNFNIETYDGVVYLMGIARTEAELREAAERASRVGGVQRVVSYVRLAPRRASESAAPLQDGAGAADASGLAGSAD